MWWGLLLLRLLLRRLLLLLLLGVLFRTTPHQGMVSVQLMSHHQVDKAVVVEDGRLCQSTLVAHGRSTRAIIAAAIIVHIRTKPIEQLLASWYVLFLASPRVLEPNLGHTFTQPSCQRYPLQILPIRIAVDLEVGLQNLNLLLGEGGPDALGFILSTTLSIATILAGGGPIVDQFHVVCLAQHPVVDDRELFPCRELPAAGVARETR